MAKLVNKLSARKVANIKKPGRHSDGGGLYLSISPNGAASWVFMWKVAGRRREMGLGSLKDIQLADARTKAATARKQVAEGDDPLSLRANTTTATFGEMADAFLASRSSGWKNVKHRAQWKMTLEVYCAPLRPKSVAEIGTDHVLAVLQPIWLEKPETASRLRGRIEQVLNFAKARGLRSGENPAQWKGHLDTILPKPRKLVNGHHAALPYKEIPSFMSRLSALKGIAPRALEFTILTAARSGEVLGLPWGELSLADRVWTVPAERMKGGREHRVPLSSRAIEILREMERLRSDDSIYVFPGGKRGRPLSETSMEAVVKRRLKVAATPHGFRSSFRDWAGDVTLHSREIAEAALSHIVGDRAEQAYRRSDALEKRRQMMDEWERYCSQMDNGADRRKKKRRGPKENALSSSDTPTTGDRLQDVGANGTLDVG